MYSQRVFPRAVCTRNTQHRKFPKPVASSLRHVIQPLDLPEALEKILAATRPVAHSETVPIDAANGRFCAADTHADTDLPPFASSAMDGYALFAATTGLAPGSLNLRGESLAGHPYSGTLAHGECIRITTGAAVPATANAVVIQENCSVQDKVVHVHTNVAEGDNIRPPGQDIGRGDIVVPLGRSINAFDVSWLAACGITDIAVAVKPRLAVFSTGDELLEPGAELTAGKIFDANRRALLELLKELPVTITDLGILPDREERIADALTEASGTHDVLLTTGGVSVGDADLVKSVIETIGELDFWRLNLKPGKPLAFGHVGECLFFGLPGNPVSAIVTYLLLTRPALIRLCGGEPHPTKFYRATLTQPIQHSPGREEYQRGLLDFSAAGLQVSATGDQSSNRLATFSKANCLIRVPQESGDIASGEHLDVLPFFGLIDGR